MANSSPYQRVHTCALLVIACGMLSVAVWFAVTKHNNYQSETGDFLPGIKININAADSAALQLLPNVGPTLADNIITQREIASLTSSADLQRIKGIGPVRAEKIAPYVIFNASPP